MFGNPPLPSERGIGNYIEDDNLIGEDAAQTDVNVYPEGDWREGEAEANWRAECERMSAEYARQQDEDNHPFTR